ncbi:IBR domain-containing protein [Streptomyces sp. CFMR 7]|uniref:IBR domain-containing protein n=1 Tax=Streptomyces sp. CFMR 7 TaxID=1649184 RepID=UPI0016430422|nr:IBR domain-containing protein [Streptomyces sp. CFMR 7]
MTQLLNTYLAWEELAHAPQCADPRWVVDIRTEHSVYRSITHGTPHTCPTPGCDHADRHDVTSVRIVCSSCGRARIISGGADAVRTTSTKALGYGQPPRKAGGLWLYPGAPLLFGWGHGEDEEPEGYLVTRTRVDRVTTDNVIGAIFKDRGPRRGVKWVAVAAPAPDGEYGYGLVRWSRKAEALRSFTAAAKWISAQGKDTGNGESTPATGTER